MNKSELLENIKETKELIKYSKKHMNCEGVPELLEDLDHYNLELKKIK